MIAIPEPLRPEVHRLARVLWEYHRLNHDPRPADAILALGSRDTRVAAWAARLFLEGLAPVLVLSGGRGRHTRDWPRPEAEVFAEIARRDGVPGERLLLETASTHTGENLLFTRELLRERGIDVRRLLLVPAPHMERRALAALRCHLPEADAVVCGPPLAFDEYPTEDLPLESLIECLVGNLQRIRDYPRRGWQVPQPIPAEVELAFRRLVAMGFSAELVEV